MKGVDVVVVVVVVVATAQYRRRGQRVLEEIVGS